MFRCSYFSRGIRALPSHLNLRRCNYTPQDLKSAATESAQIDSFLLCPSTETLSRKTCRRLFCSSRRSWVGVKSESNEMAQNSSSLQHGRSNRLSFVFFLNLTWHGLEFTENNQRCRAKFESPHLIVLLIKTGFPPKNPNTSHSVSSTLFTMIVAGKSEIGSLHILDLPEKKR